MPLDTIKIKTRKITQTPYRLFLDDRISTYSYPDSMIKLIILRFDTLDSIKSTNMDLDSDGKENIDSLKKNLESMTLKQLKPLCKEKGLNVSGKKSDLVTRLLNPEPPPKHKRPDLVAKRDEMKDSEVRVIKKSLIGTLKCKELYPIINDWVTDISKTMNRGSLVFNRFLIHYFSNGLELPNFNQDFFNHCFKVGIRDKIPLTVQFVWDQYFGNFPVPESKIGDFQPVTWATKTYITVFNNSLQFNFESRQKRYIRHWLEQNNLNKEWIHSIRCAVNGWNCKTKPPLEATEFIESQRRILNPPKEGISDNWLKGNSNRNTILYYFWIILQYLETIETAKKFNLAPIHSISSHFLTIDTDILHYISKEAGLFSEENIKLIDFRSKKDYYFHRIFKFKIPKQYKFNYHIKTDGVSVCFEYLVPKPKVENKKETQKYQYERMIGVDPGRSNIIFGVEKTSKGLETYRITRNEYYCASGMTKRNRQAFKWQQDIQAEEQIFSQVSPKTTNPEQWDSFLGNYLSVYDRLWKAKTGKKWARARFRVFGLKKKVIDRFFNRMEGTVKPLICFGSAKFKPNGKGELSAPTTSIFKACEKRFTVELIDEFRTTKTCVDCDHILSPVMVYSKKLGKYREIRGLRRCSSSVCSQTSYKNRDLNAALNILRCEPSFPRPKTLSRESSEEIPKVRPWYLRHTSSTLRDKKLTATPPVIFIP
jgi:hypothetical protein